MAEWFSHCSSKHTVGEPAGGQKGFVYTVYNQAAMWWLLYGAEPARCGKDILESSYICRMRLLCPIVSLQPLKSTACYHGCGTGNIPAADEQVPSSHRGLAHGKPVAPEQERRRKVFVPHHFSKEVLAVVHLSGAEATSLRRPT
jgi:hypothetical protein